MYVFLYLSRFFVDLPNTPKGISSYYCSKFYASSKTYSGIFRVPFFLSVSQRLDMLDMLATRRVDDCIMSENLGIIA